MAIPADWTTLPDLTNEEWNNDYHTLFGSNGTVPDVHDEFATVDPEFDESLLFLSELQEPEQMEWEQDVMGAWGVPTGPTQPSNKTIQTLDSAIHAMQQFSQNDAVDSTATKLRKRSTNKSSSSSKGSTHKKQPRMTAEAKQILLDHFVYSPYPTTTEIEVLANRTKLEPKRVRTWFNNHRCRQPRPGRCSSTIPQWHL